MNEYNDTDATTDHAKNSPENDCDACRTPSCHAQISVQVIITADGSVTLCHDCRQQFTVGVSS